MISGRAGPPADEGCQEPFITSLKLFEYPLSPPATRALKMRRGAARFRVNESQRCTV